MNASRLESVDNAVEIYKRLCDTIDYPSLFNMLYIVYDYQIPLFSVHLLLAPHNSFRCSPVKRKEFRVETA